MVNIIPVASGKGGVGKSVISVNLATVLAAKEKKVILCDFDLGASNLHTMLGLPNNHIGTGNYIYHKEPVLSHLLQETGIPNLRFISGDCLFPGTANMDFFTKKKIIKELPQLNADYLIMDLSSGSAYNTLDFFLMTTDAVLVSIPEITAALNAYSFLKAAVFRFFSHLFPAKSDERLFITDFLKNIPPGTESSFLSLQETLCSKFPETGNKAVIEVKKICPRIIINSVNSSVNFEVFRRLQDLCVSKLGLKIKYIGVLPWDSRVSLSVAQRVPLYRLNPSNPFSAAMEKTVTRILELEPFYTEQDSLDATDIELLQSEFENKK